MARIRKSPPGVDPKLLVRHAAKLLPDPARRAFLRGGASLGAVAFLAGCDIIDGPTAENALSRISRFNDRVQAWIFGLNRLAPTYPESATHPAVSVQRLLFRGRRARSRWRKLQAENRRPRAGEKILVVAGTPRIAGRKTDHAPHLRRRLERDRKLERSKAVGFSATHRRRYQREIHQVSSAPRVIRHRSTWRRRCIRRPR